MSDVSELLHNAVKYVSAGTAVPEGLNAQLRTAFQNSAQPSILPDVEIPTRKINVGIPEQKMEAVRNASDEKRVRLGGTPSPETIQRAVTARATGSGVESATGTERDLIMMPMEEVQAKYGRETADQMLRLSAAQTTSKFAKRSWSDTIGDALSGTTLAAASTVGGIGSFGVGLVNDRAGAAIAQKVQEMNDVGQSWQSSARQAHRQVAAQKHALDKRDNEKQYEEDKAKGDGILADLNYFGREALNSATDTFSSGDALAETVESGVGSLAIAGPVGKGIGFAGKGLSKLGVLPGSPAEMRVAAEMNRALGNKGTAMAQRAAATVAEIAPSEMTTSIALQEAGGAHQQTAADIMGKSDEELLATSPEFRRLVSLPEDGGEGLSFDEAKARVANRGGLVAAAIAGAAGAAVGKVAGVGEFEANPLSRGQRLTTKAILGNLAKETGEEGAQGITGQAGQNVGQMLYGDENTKMVEGMGEQVAQGALGGLGAAGVMQAHKVPRALARDALGKLVEAGEAQQAKNAEKSPASDTSIALAGEQAQAVATAPETQAILQDAISQAHARDALNASDDSKENTDHGPRMEAMAQKILDFGKFDPKEVENTTLSPEIKAEVSGATNRIDYLQKLAEAIDKRGPGDIEGLKAAIHIVQTQKGLLDLIRQDPEAFGAIDDNHAAGVLSAQFQDLSQNISANPKIGKAMSFAYDLKPEETAAILGRVDEKSLTPEKAKDIATIAEVAPTSLDPETLNTVFAHHEATNDLGLDARQLNHLKAAQALMGGVNEAMPARNGQSSSDAAMQRIAAVNADFMEGDRKGPKDKSNSMKGFVQRIAEHMTDHNTRGDMHAMGRAQAEFENMRGVVEAMHRKMEALNKSYATGNQKEPYQAWSGRSQSPYRNNTTVGVAPYSERSVTLAQTIAQETDTATRVYNNMARAFPEASGDNPIKSIPRLPKELQGDVKDVVSRHKDQWKGNPTARATPEAVNPISRKNAWATPQGIAQFDDTRLQKAVTHWGELAQKGDAESKAIHGLLSQEANKRGLKPAANQGESQEGTKPPSKPATKPAETKPAEKPAEDRARYGDLTSEEIAYMEDLYKLEDKHRLLPEQLRVLERLEDKAAAFYERQGTGQNASAEPPIVPRVTSVQTDQAAQDAQTTATPAGKDVGFSEPTLFRHLMKLTQRQGTPEARPTDARTIETLSARLADILKAKHTTSRITPEQAARLDREGLEKRMNPIRARLSTIEEEPTDKPTLAVLYEANRALQAKEAEEAKAAAEAARIEKETPAIKKLFAGLVGSKFYEAFRPKKDATRVAGQANPIANVLAMLTNNKTWQAATGNKNKIVSDPMSDAIHHYVKTCAPKMKEIMRKRLQDKMGQKAEKGKLAGKTIEEWMNEGMPLDDTVSLRNLGMLVKTEDGKYDFHPELLDLSVLAALQWVLVAKQFAPHLDEEKMAELTGLPLEKGNISRLRKLARWHNGSMSSIEAVRSLADMLTDFWGVEPDHKQSMSYTDGFPYAMAAELLNALQNTPYTDATGALHARTGLLESNPLTSGEDTHKIMDRLRPTISARPFPKNPKVVHSLFTIPSLISETVLLKSKVDRYFNGNIPEAPKHQLNNRGVPLAEEQKTAIEHENRIGHQLDVAWYKFTTAMTETFAMNVFGGGELKGRVLNKNHRDALEGKNLTIQSAFRDVMSVVGEMGQLKGELADQVIHYEHGMSSIGRIQQLGGQTPQLSKWVRELILPTWSRDIDVSEGSNYHKLFLRALAQAMGGKIHEMDDNQVASFVRNLVTAENAPMRSIVETFHNHFDNKGVEPLKFEAVIKEAFQKRGLEGEKPKLTVNALKMLWEQARWEKASKAERQKFTTAAYIEADGVTNGLVNALHLLTTGPHTREQLINAMRGGKFFAGVSDYPSTDMIQWRNTAEGKTDMYGAVGEKHLIELDKMFAGLEDPEVRTQADHLLHLFAVLKMDVDIRVGADGDPHLYVDGVDRGVVKNPATITLYGSSPGGIASNIAGELMDKLYERLSGMSEDEARWFFQNNGSRLQALVTRKVKTDEGGALSVVQTKVRTNDINLAREEFTFNSWHMDVLEQNIQSLFVQPMVKAIEGTVGNTVIDNGKTVIAATQAQSIVLAHLFKQRVIQAMKDKGIKFDPDTGKPSQGQPFLSDAEIDKIAADLQKEFPLIDTGSQLFSPAKSEMFEHNFLLGSALGGEHNVPGAVFIPANSEVKALPQMNVGMGDGNMIQIMANKFKSKGLKVFDGVNFALTDIMEGSLQANHAAWLAQQGNPMKALLKSYKAFLSNQDMETLLKENMDLGMALSDGMRLGQKLGLGKDEIATDEQIINELKLLQSKLQEGAWQVEARHMAEAEFVSHNDQMAGVGAAFETPGTKFEGTLDELVDALREGYARHYKTLSGKEAEMPPLVPQEKIERPAHNREAYSPEGRSAGTTPASNPASSAAEAPTSTGIGTKGRRSKASGVRTIAMSGVRKLAQAMPLKPLQRKVVDAVLGSKFLDGYTIIHGTKEQILAHLKGVNPGFSSTGVDHGLTDVGTKTIYLLTDSAETFTHELIHAATVAALRAHFAGTINPDQKDHVGEAVGRLQALMGRFLGADTSSMSEGLRKAFSDAREAIAKHGTDETTRLTEFMAWVLANQNLANIAEKTVDTAARPLMGRLVNGVKSFFQKLFWTGKGAKSMPEMPGTDMFSNVLFNMAVVSRAQVEGQPNLNQQSREVFAHNTESDERLEGVAETYRQVMGRFVGLGNADFTPQMKAIRETEQSHAAMHASKVLDLALDAQFGMTAQARGVFTNLVTALSLETQLDPNSAAMLHEIYRTAIQKIDIADLANPNDGEQAQVIAQHKWDMLVGSRGIEMDKAGRSSLVPAFIALAHVDEDLRRALSKIELPGFQANPEKTLDAKGANLANRALFSLANKMAGVGYAANLQQAVETLTKAMSESVLAGESPIAKAFTVPNSYVHKANDFVVDLLEKGSDRLMRSGLKKALNGSTAVERTLGKLESQFAGLLHAKHASHVGETVLGMMNQLEGSNAVRDFMSDLVGRTNQNASLFDLIKIGRKMVQKMRQEFRDHLPKLIRKQFSEKLSKEQWSDMFHGLARTDIACLAEHFSNADTLKFVGDLHARQREIDKILKQIRTLDPRNATLMEKKARQLATYMLTGNPGINLQRNAQGIADLINERVRPANNPSTKGLVDEIDKLVSLLALHGTNQERLDRLAELAQKEPAGMDFVLSYLKGQRATEAKKAVGMGKYNAFKGHVPSTQQEGRSLVIADRRYATDLLNKGYVEVAPYTGSRAEGRSQRAYYFLPASARAAFNQGLLQNVRQTAGGVDLSTGFIQSGVSGGVIMNPKKVADINSRLQSESGTKENLLPVVDEDGQVVAFERAVDPVQLARLNNSTDLSEMMGVWRGRQMEEDMALKFNKGLIDKAHDMWIKDKEHDAARAEKAYVDLKDPRSYGNDPVITDAVKLFTPEVWEHIGDVFGGKFMVRKDMIKDVIGYRAASVGDAWTGISRLDPKVHAQVRNVAMGVFGAKAYQKLVNYEHNWQTMVKEAKFLIVVKSIVVPVVNFTSNIYQLMGRGVPITDIMKAVPRITVEAELYNKTHARLMEAEGELFVAQANKNGQAEQRLRAEIQGIEDSHRRLSIWPLIEKGEFGAISDINAQEDHLLLSGRLDDYMTQLVDKLPAGVKAAGRHAVIAHDTALAHGLKKAVEYGDFIGKVIRYEHLTKRRGMDKDKAMAEVSEEFVHYDRLSGRTRDALEKNGLLWFMNYKIRSAKVALSMVRDNPVQTLLSSFMPIQEVSPIKLDSPLQDNLFSKIWDGTFGYAVGPGMGLHSWRLNPWVNAFSHIFH